MLERVLSFVIGDFELRYWTPTGELVYRFDHGKYDAARMALAVKRSRDVPVGIPPVLNIGPPIPISPDTSFTSFTRAVVSMIRKCFLHDQKKSYQVLIHVSTRTEQTQDQAGSRVIYTRYRVRRDASESDMCRIHTQAVRLARQKARIITYETWPFYASGCDLIFNSWRSLGEIKRQDGLALKLMFPPVDEEKWLNSTGCRDCRMARYGPDWHVIKLGTKQETVRELRKSMMQKITPPRQPVCV